MASWSRSSQSDGSNESLDTEPQVRSNPDPVENQTMNTNAGYSEPSTSSTTDSGLLNTWVATEEVLATVVINVLEQTSEYFFRISRRGFM